MNRAYIGSRIRHLSLVRWLREVDGWIRAVNPRCPCNPRSKTKALTKNRIPGSIIPMKIKTLCLALALALAAAAVCLAGHTKAEQAPRDADAACTTAAGNTELDKTISYSSDDATVR